MSFVQRAYPAYTARVTGIPAGSYRIRNL